MSLLSAFARTALSFAAAASLSAGALAAEDPPSPTALKGGKIITPADAKKLLDAKTATFVDPRSAVNYGKGHVPGAVLVAYKGKSENVENFDAALDSFPMDKLPKDKAAPVIFYGHGDTGWKAYKAAVLAINAGYSKVHFMRAGMQGWEAGGLPVEH